MEKKKYETPEMEVMNLETAPLLAGSGTTGTGPNATWGSRSVGSDDEEDY